VTPLRSGQISWRIMASVVRFLFMFNVLSATLAPLSSTQKRIKFCIGESLRAGRITHVSD